MEFSDLDDLYLHIEEAAAESKYAHSIGDMFQKLRNKLTDDGDMEEAIIAQWEIDFFNFRFKEGKCKSTFEGTSGNGEPFNWPNFGGYNEWTYAYLKRRLSSSTNPILVSRYAHILWCSPKKHSIYGRKAIAAYFQEAEIWKSKDIQFPADHYGISVVNSISSAYFLARSVNYRLDDVKKIIRDLLLSFNWESSSFFSLRSQLLRLMLKDRKNFKVSDFVGLDELCDKVGNMLINRDNYFAASEMYKHAYAISVRVGKQNDHWLNMVAYCYELQYKNSQASDNLANVTYCQTALEYYKKAKNQEKLKEFSQLYVESKSKFNLVSFSEEIDLSEQVNYYRSVAKKISKKSSEEIIRILMYDTNLLPSKVKMEADYEEQKEKYVLQDIFPATIIDGQGHTIKHFTTDTEKRYWGILQNYAISLRFSTNILIKQIVVQSCDSGKLSAESILTYFKSNSWVGQKITKKTPSGETYFISWIAAIAPAVIELFKCLEVGALSGDIIGGLVLCIDSLSMKFEGLFREICQLSGMETFRIKDDNMGRSVYMEKDLHALLTEDAVTQLFHEDDLLFYKYLLVEQAGMSLRHSIAHGLVTNTNYSLDSALLLLLALLRVAKYQLTSR